MSKVNKIIVEYKDGSTYTIINEKDIVAILNSLLTIKPSYIKSTQKETLSNKYFHMITELSKSTNIGYNKAEMHEYLKPLLFRKFIDFKHFFTTGIPEYSTRNLTVEGWEALIEQLKSTVGDIFGYVFKTN